MKGGVYLLLAASFLTAGMAGVARGQYWNPTYIDQMVLDNINLRRAEERAADRRKEAGNSRQQQPPAAPARRRPAPPNNSATADKLVFRQSPSRLLPKELVKNRPASERAELERTFNDALDFFEAEIARNDFDYRNIADVLALYVNFNYGMYRGGSALSRAEHGALREDIAAGLLRDKNFLSASDADKQMMYEARVITLVLLSELMKDAQRRKDTERIKTLRDKAKGNVEQFFGTDLGSIKFTASGVQIKQK